MCLSVDLTLAIIADIDSLIDLSFYIFVAADDLLSAFECAPLSRNGDSTLLPPSYEAAQQIPSTGWLCLLFCTVSFSCCVHWDNNG